MYKYGTSLTPRAYDKNELVAACISPQSLRPIRGKPPHELGQPLAELREPSDGGARIERCQIG
jgi:hypothetical protein